MPFVSAPVQVKPGPAPAGSPVLDAVALAALAQLDPGGANHLVSRILSTYRASLERLMQQLAEARSRDDLAAVRMVTHTLKSSSASIGALALSALCADAEQAAREPRDDALEPLLDSLQAEAARVDTTVRDLLSTYP